MVGSRGEKGHKDGGCSDKKYVNNLDGARLMSQRVINETSQNPR